VRRAGARPLLGPTARDFVFLTDAGLVLERVDIHRVQMNALTIDSMDMNARGVCS
jgi:hypothetical protein